MGDNVVAFFKFCKIVWTVSAYLCASCNERSIGRLLPFLLCLVYAVTNLKIHDLKKGRGECFQFSFLNSLKGCSSAEYEYKWSEYFFKELKVSLFGLPVH